MTTKMDAEVKYSSTRSATVAVPTKIHLWHMSGETAGRGELCDELLVHRAQLTVVRDISQTSKSSVWMSFRRRC